MSVNQIKAIFVLVFMIVGSILIGYGSNWLIGFGVFFCLWSLAGILESISDEYC
jgi:hypothetical protein